MSSNTLVKSKDDLFVPKDNVGVITAYLPEENQFAIMFNNNKWISFSFSEKDFFNHFEIMEQFTFFWGGEFSQWFPSNFVIDGIKYSTCEKYMMAKKAELFGDTDILDKIMKSDDPRQVKAFGRLIKGFDKDKWEAVCKKIVYDGNYAKFTQNKKLLNVLNNTHGTTLVEASPEDKIWGIGLAAYDPRSKDRNKWLGTNWLGEVITQVREDILKTVKKEAKEAV
jgi:hypothetical protein